MEGIVMESVWVAVGFVVFVALVWKKAGSAISAMLDERSEKIRAELDEARALREEALDELHQFQRLRPQVGAAHRASSRAPSSSSRWPPGRPSREAVCPARRARPACRRAFPCPPCDSPGK